MGQVFREIKQEISFYATRQLNYPAHIHEDIELIYTRNGSGNAYCDGKRYELAPNSFFLVFPNQVHHYADCADGDYILLILKPHHLFGNYELYFNGYPTAALAHILQTDTTVTLLQMALEEYNSNGSDLVLQSLLTAFFEKLIEHYNIVKGQASSETVLRILQYCAAHFKEEITVTDVAEKLGLSNSTVSHTFGQRLGIRFNEHIHTLRLSEAVQLLHNRHYSVTDISAMVGFPTIRTFNRAFLKQHGISPSAYRKRILNDSKP